MRDDKEYRDFQRTLIISIHVPRMRDDIAPVAQNAGWSLISIHVPRMRDDDLSEGTKDLSDEFQSTSLA